MKAIFSILFVLATTSLSIPQIDESLKRLILRDGTVYITYGTRITHVYGEWEYRNSAAFGPVTNIAYLTYTQLMVKVRDTAKLENWDEQRYRKSADYFRKNAKGGAILVYVERFDFYLTNMKFFSIIIRDTLERKNQEYEFPYQPATIETTDRFSNWALYCLADDPGKKFFVNINHKHDEHLTDTRFIVEPLAMLRAIE